MPERCLLYYITDRTAFASDEPTRRRRLLEKIAEAARAGVDCIQVREKDLPTHELESLANDAMTTIREAIRLTTDHSPLTTALLINSRTDVALAAHADGVHLRADDISPQEVSAVWKKSQVAPACPAAQGAAVGPSSGFSTRPLIGVSCHSPAEAAQAAADRATFAVFAPVFEKKDIPDTKPAGLAQLREACRAGIPVLALGGVTLENAKSCLDAGAAGIAAIRLFQAYDIAEVVTKLRSL